MKKISLVFSIVLTLLLTGCFEMTDEITLKSDGSGVFTSTNDMSMLIAMAKSMGGAEAMKGAEDKATDTTVSLVNLVDSMASLTADEKKLVRNGKLGIKVDMKEEKMVTKLELPFSNIDQLAKLKGLAAKISQHALTQSAGAGLPPGMDDNMSPDPFNDYFDTKYSSGGIEKKLNKEKYAGVETSESMKALKEMADGGLPFSNTTIINLPKPAKKVEGKNVTLSEDKKKVTIKSSAENFFDDPSSMEFKIEY